VPDPKAKAAEYGCRLFESAEALVQSSEVDAVYVLTNMETHLQVSLFESYVRYWIAFFILNNH
jgi:predicted dehydrogenase